MQIRSDTAIQKIGTTPFCRRPSRKESARDGLDLAISRDSGKHVSASPDEGSLPARVQDSSSDPSCEVMDGKNTPNKTGTNVRINFMAASE